MFWRRLTWPEQQLDAEEAESEGAECIEVDVKAVGPTVAPATTAQLGEPLLVWPQHLVGEHPGGRRVTVT